VCNPKEFGGLGVKDIGVQNVCLLLELIHRLYCPGSSAWSQWIQGRVSLATLQGEVHGEHWQVLRQLLPLYQAITSVKLGNGKSCSFWNDVWIGDEALADAFPSLFSHCTFKNGSVHEILSNGLEHYFVPRLSHAAQSDMVGIRLLLSQTSLSNDEDRRTSCFAKADSSLHSGAIYKMIKARGQPSDPSAVFVWKSYAPPRIQLFMWLLAQNQIQCRSNLHRKHIVDNPCCEICQQEEETTQHILSACPLASQLWQSLQMTPPLQNLANIQNWVPPPSIPTDGSSTFIALCCWQLWKARNEKVFRNQNTSLSQLLQSCISLAAQWSIRLPVKKKHLAQVWELAFQVARQGQG